VTIGVKRPEKASKKTEKSGFGPVRRANRLCMGWDIKVP